MITNLVMISDSPESAALSPSLPGLRVMVLTHCGAPQSHYIACNKSLLASLEELKLTQMSARLPLGLNLRRYTIHGRLCVRSVFKYRQLLDISYVRLVQWPASAM